MDLRYYRYKLFWWIREHLFFWRNLTKHQQWLEYELPAGYGDWAVHPCVRYIPEGLGRSCWWMALSPYPGFDTTKENILLYKGENTKDSVIPLKWTFVKEVSGSHSKGYNSDPNLYYDEDKKELWVIWREWETKNVPDESPLCCTLFSKTNNGIKFSTPEILALNRCAQDNLPADTQMSPTVIDFGGFRYLYGVHYSFEPNLFPRGFCRYEYDGMRFELSDSRPWKDRSFDFWHIDMFQHSEYLYQVITGRSGNAIYLGRSKNGLDFEYSHRPLYSWRWFVRKNYFYKASALVYNDNLYLFFPRKQKNNSVKIVARSMPISKLDNFF